MKQNREMAKFLSAEWMDEVARLSAEHAADQPHSPGLMLDPIALVVTGIPGESEPRETVITVAKGTIRFTDAPAKTAKFGAKVAYETARRLIATPGGLSEIDTGEILREVQPLGNVFAAMAALPKLRNAFSDELRVAIAAITD